MVILLKSRLLVNDGVETIKTRVVEIGKSEEQPGSSCVQEESHGDTQYKDIDELNMRRFNKKKYKHINNNSR